MKSDLWRRIGSGFLALSLLVSSVPVNVFAEGNDEDSSYYEEAEMPGTIDEIDDGEDVFQPVIPSDEVPDGQENEQPGGSEEEDNAAPGAEDQEQPDIPAGNDEEVQTPAPEQEQEKQPEEQPEEQKEQPEEPEEEEPRDPMEIAAALTLQSWWYRTENNQLQELPARTEDRTVIYDFSETLVNNPEVNWTQMGWNLAFSLDGNEDLQVGDWFTFKLPGDFAQLYYVSDPQHWERAYPGFMQFELQRIEEVTRKYYVLTGKLLAVPEGESASGVVHLGFDFADAILEKAGETLDIAFNEHWTYRVIYTNPALLLESQNLISPQIEGEGEGEDTEENEEEQEVTAVSIGPFSFEYENEELWEQWKVIVRPSDFVPPVMIKLYGESDTELQSATLQSTNPNEPFYMEMGSDGNFTICNVPKAISQNNDSIGVKKYSVQVTASDIPYYNSSDPVIIEAAEAAEPTLPGGTLKMSLKTAEMKFMTAVEPDTEGKDQPVPMNVAFTHGVHTIYKTYRPTPSAPVSVQVPVGLDYIVEQQTPAAYTWDGKYNDAEATDGKLTGKVDNQAAEISTKIVLTEYPSFAMGPFKLHYPNDGEWKEWIRPDVFDYPVNIRLYYEDEDGPQFVEYPLQDLISTEPFYMLLEHDGNGEGSLTIQNIPKTVTVDGAIYLVEKYGVEVDTSKYPYYSSQEVLVEVTDPSATVQGSLEMNMVTAELQFSVSVLPETEDQSLIVPMEVVYTNNLLTKENDEKQQETPQRKQTYNPTPNSPYSVQVPLGLNYTVEQTTPAAYKWDGEYKCSDPEAEKENQKLSGVVRELTMEDEKIVSNKISTTLVSQSHSHTFNVKWEDNNRANRPTVNQDDFVLEYSIDGETWVTLPAIPSDEVRDALDLDENWTYGWNEDIGNAVYIQYSFTGLPMLDKNQKPVLYRVQCKQPLGEKLNDYTTDRRVEPDKEGQSNSETIIFHEKTTFTASIEWKDGHNAILDGTDNVTPRPTETSKVPLKLYRRVGSGDYEPVKMNGVDINVADCVYPAEGGNTWNIKILNLPRYNSEDEEYDYVIVQGEIETDDETKKQNIIQKPVVTDNIASYKTYYNNGSGNYGTDFECCHNGGKITEKLVTNKEFKVNKVWQDPQDTTRPEATVTLWRYVREEVEAAMKTAGATGNALDYAFRNGLAAQVSYTQNGTEEMMSLPVPQNDGEIDFKSFNVPLEGNDDLGRKYVYFVRETLTGDGAENYSVSYHDQDSTAHSEGALAGGTITNTRREKTSVLINKIWQIPGSLESIQDSSIQAILYAPLDGGAEDEYYPLTVYSADMNSYETLTGEKLKDAQTIDGFTSIISSGETTYYVNSYNENGQKYALEKAVVQEIVRMNSGAAPIEVPTYDPNTHKFDVEPLPQGSTSTYKKVFEYKADSKTMKFEAEAACVGSQTLGDGKTQYRYRQTNTITETRDYRLTKMWYQDLLDHHKDPSDNSIYLDRGNKQDKVIAVVIKLTQTHTDGSEERKDIGYYAVSYSNLTDFKDSDGKKIGETWNTQCVTGLEKYDANGFPYRYSASEVGFLLEGYDGISEDKIIELGSEFEKSDYYLPVQQTREQYAWNHHDSIGLDGTIVYNYRHGTDVHYFNLMKEWNDNSDGIRDENKVVMARVYDRDQFLQAVKAQQEAKSAEDDAIADLSTILAINTESEVQYKEVTLKRGNNYLVEIHLKDLPNYRARYNDGQTTPISEWWKKYIVLEYTVGTANGTLSEQVAQYTYGQLKEAAANSTTIPAVHGTVENSLRKYKTVISAPDKYGSVTITNTRTGDTTIAGTKIWKDEVPNDKRASICFQLYMNGGKYTEISDDVYDHLECTNGKLLKEHTDNDQCRCGVSLDRQTGVITVTKDALRSVTAGEVPPAENGESSNNGSSGENDSQGGNSSGTTEPEKFDQWYFEIKNLPMFSIYGVVISYDMDEIIDENTIYFSEKGKTTADGVNKTQSFSFNFTNTAVGTTFHVSYKIWNDTAIGPDNRPDLYMTLERRLKNDTSSQWTKVEDEGSDQIWFPSPEEAQKMAGDGNPSGGNEQSELANKGNYLTSVYNWKIIVDDLPKYDAYGREYVYRFTEKMNNSGETVMGTYVGSKDNTRTDDATGDTYEVFTNVISDYMTFQGQKTWTGLAGYKTSDGLLPDPTIWLFRTTSTELNNNELQSYYNSIIRPTANDSNDEPSSEARTSEVLPDAVKAVRDHFADKGLTFIDKTQLTEKKSFSFPSASPATDLVRNVDGNWVLDKFDENGNPYYYLVLETIEDPIASQLYTKTNANGTLANTFRTDLNRRTIEVKKEWTGMENLAQEEKIYPDVTFKLYRYELNSAAIDALNDSGIIPIAEAGAESTGAQAILIDSKTVTGSEFKTAAGNCSVTFGRERGDTTSTNPDLLIFSPTGVQYGYFVIEEMRINQSSTVPTAVYTMTPEDEMLSEKQYSIVTDTGHELVNFEPEMIAKLSSNGRMDILSLPDNWNDETGTYPKASVKAQNRYNSGDKLTFSGVKQWDDYGNAEGLRPTKTDESGNPEGIQLYLRRYASSGRGGAHCWDPESKTWKTEYSAANVQPIPTTEAESGSTPYITWVYGEGESWKTASTWSFTIHNLDRYAPDGSAYTYVLYEKEAVTGYKQAEHVIQKAPAQGDVVSKVVTNGFEGEFYVRKVWSDGNDRYGLRPATITVVLERTTTPANASSWKRISIPADYAGTSTKDYYPHSSYSDENIYVSKDLDREHNEAPKTNNGAWEYTFKNLPVRDKDGYPYYYRAVETRIGGVKIEMNSDNLMSAGAYTYSDDSETRTDNTKSKLTNVLSKTSLRVTKGWNEDEDNVYSDQAETPYESQPETISFILQKRGYIIHSSETGTDTPNEGEGDNTSVDPPDSSQDPKVGESDTSFDWIDVCDPKTGEPYVYTITRGADGKWPVKVLEDLPTAEIIMDSQGHSYTVFSLYFRAWERHADDVVVTNEDGTKTTKRPESSTEARPTNAQNYTDTTDYSHDFEAGGSTESLSHYYDNQQSCNISKLGNQVITDDELKEISVTKVWHFMQKEGKEVSATFELLYSTDNQKWFAFNGQEVNNITDRNVIPFVVGGDQTVTLSHICTNDVHPQCVTQTVTATEPCTQTVTWDHLPKYDKEGHELYYKVVEHEIQGFKAETVNNLSVAENEAQSLGIFDWLISLFAAPQNDGEEDNEVTYPTAYTFTNTELQSYKVVKTWAKSPEGAGNDTSTFRLEKCVVPKAVLADQYVYTDNPYTYAGKRVVEGNKITAYYKTNATDKNVINDMARYLGALYHSGVSEIEYGNVVYTWDASQGLKGSNWYNAANQKTLVTQVVLDAQTPSSVGPLTWDGNKYNFTFERNDTKYEQSIPTAQTYEQKFDDAGVNSITLPTSSGEQSYTWTNLPKYDPATGGQIIYRAVETKINDVVVDENKDYAVSYLYDTNRTVPTFEGTETDATNRMIYGFVNLSKQAAYLAPGVTGTGANLKDIVFKIQKKENGQFKDYVSGVKTNEDGYLIQTNGKYGDEQKYLITGEYKLLEDAENPNPNYSVWDKGIEFKVGPDGTGNTGEHGTAWIITSTNVFGNKIKLETEYKSAATPIGGSHYFGDPCVPYTKQESDNPAYNIESRGVLSFTKMGKDTSTNLDTHAGAKGESSPYFGVYVWLNPEEGKTPQESDLKQVAGLVPYSTLIAEANEHLSGGQQSTITDENRWTFVLTNKTQNGATISEVKTGTEGDQARIPYLRAFVQTTYPLYQFTLLSGTYYIREEVAPAGYRLDDNIRKLTVRKIESTKIETDLSGLYPGNTAVIEGLVDNKWTNQPNVVELHKMDQYGRNVSLEGKPLLLEVIDPGVTFKTGDTQIYLYQDSNTPATTVPATTDNNNPVEKVTGISYSDGVWTITGLFDAGKHYQISEPDTSVPDVSIKAAPIQFTVGTDGTLISVVGAESKEDATAVNGDDYKNYYHADEQKNVMVMRDVSRFLLDVGLHKYWMKTADEKENIQYISFKLYEYTDIADGTPKYENGDPKPVLKDDVYLTTDENGMIVLSKTAAGIKNLRTGCDLRFGLEIGKYYFEEVERGASDSFKLGEKVFFEISRKNPDTTPEEPTPEPANESSDAPEQTPETDMQKFAKYAKVDFEEKDGYVAQEADSLIGDVKNDPVEPKTLALTKLDPTENKDKLKNAQFELIYTSVNGTQPGSANTDTVICVTNEQGELRLQSDPTIVPDISRKGDYVLKEIKAPDAEGEQKNYMTPTDAQGAAVVMLEFSVGSNNQITINNDTKNALVTESQVNGNTLNATVKNEQTVVYVAKRNDITGDNDQKTKDQRKANGEMLSKAMLQIFAGTEVQGTPVAEWVSTGSATKLAPGLLKEKTIYTLHEKQTPTGYLTANDLYFYIFGTTTRNNETVSQLYVWSDTGKPTSTEEGSWSEKTNVNSGTLTMVDEAVIAPVDMQKVVGDETTYAILPGAQFEVYAGNSTSGTKLGVVESSNQDGNKGYLVWKEITSLGSIKDEQTTLSSSLIYDASGNRISESTKSTVIGQTVILQKNADGYTFKEINAPDHAYNNHGEYQVKITDDNYRAYKTSSGYDTTQYIDILAASKVNNHEVTALCTRNADAEAFDLVNPKFITHFQLYKYDAEHHSSNQTYSNYATIGLEGVEFTLYRKNSSGEYVAYPEANGAKHTTGASGLLSFDIHDKGDYELKETATKQGYILSSEALEFKVVNDDYKQTLSYLKAGKQGTETTNTVRVKDANDNLIQDTTTYGMPNSRKHGSVTLTKKDANSSVPLNGVQYILYRTDPVQNQYWEKDNFVPTVQDASNTGALILETGKTYENLYAATSKDQFTAEKQGDVGMSTGNDGELKITGLQWGTYVLKEVHPHPGYKLDATPKSWTFTVGAENDTRDETDSDRATKLADQTMEHSNTKNQLTVAKVKAEDGTTQLGGAKFSLYAVTEEKEVEAGKVQLTLAATPTPFYESLEEEAKATETTITAGMKTVYGIPNGSYVLRETKAPDGYELAPYVYFVLHEDGTVSNVITCSVTGSVVTKDTQIQLTNYNQPFVAQGTGAAATTLTVSDNPITVSLTKALKNDGDVCGSRGNASFTIAGKFADGTDPKTFNLNTITTELNAMLIGGQDYTITETVAPAGYEVQQNVAKIHVNTDGTITVTEGTAFLTLKQGDPTAMIYTDEPIEIDLRKVKTDGTTMIEESDDNHAVFSVTGKFVTNNTVDTVPRTIDNLTTSEFTITGDQKTLSFKDTLSGRLIVGETYTVSETHAPKGYERAKDFTFTVNAQGKIETISDGANGIGIGNDVLSVKNDPTKVAFLKVDGEGNPLEGAVLKLSGTFVNTESCEPVTIVDNKISGATEQGVVYKLEETESSTSLVWVSGKTAVSIENMLILGQSYTLSEIGRVNGYEVMSSERPVQFTLTNNLDTNNVLTESGIMEIKNAGAFAVLEGDVAKLSQDEQGKDNPKQMEIANPWIKGTVVLTKYKSDSQGGSTTGTLQGAVFELYRTHDEHGDAIGDATGEQIKTNDNVYDINGTKTQFTTGQDGKITVTNLPEGSYYFIEVDAPKAYYVDPTHIEFEIHNDSRASTTCEAVDPRLNATIQLTKYTQVESTDGQGQKVTTELPLSGVKFKVKYKAESDGEYYEIGEAGPTDESGRLNLEKAIFTEDATSETLWRGFYRLTEIEAAGQMLNDQSGNKNTIEFEIVNVYGKTYVIKQDGNTYNLGDSKYITLNTDGVVDKPIPNKTVSVEKVWEGDDGMTATFRPDSIKVELYRKYTDSMQPEKVTEIELNQSNEWKHTWDKDSSNNPLPAYVNVDGTTYLYKYTVQEVDPKSWYNAPVYVVNDFNNEAYEGGGDGDSEDKVTNTLTGGAEAPELKITKSLGGGSGNDTFYVRVKLTDKDNNSIGNKGYYLDEYTTTGTIGKVTPDVKGWMAIKSGETITVKLPKGVHYQVEEWQGDGTDGPVNPATNTYHYTTRYVSDCTSGTNGITADTNASVRNAVHKSIKLTKVGPNGAALDASVVAQAKFKVTYEPRTGAPDGWVMENWVAENCTIDTNTSKLKNSSGVDIDITPQGIYTIYESKAPIGYITPTDNNGELLPLAVIKVDEEDIMTVQKGSSSNAGALVTLNGTDYKGLTADGSVADLTVTNEPTKARFGKTIDYAAAPTGGDADEGSYLAGVQMQILDGNTVIHTWTTGEENNPFITNASALKEVDNNGVPIVYTLHEVSAPVGYKTAKDVHFKLDGTYTVVDSDPEVETRYSRIVLVDYPDCNYGSGYGQANVVDGILNMADETIIAPVNLKKVLANKTTGDKWTAVKDVKFTVKTGEEDLGVAVTNEYGYLVWDSITEYGYGSKLIYDEAGHIISESVPANTQIILRETTGGYTFTESEAPDNVHNDGRIYHVYVDECNYNAYRTGTVTGKLYDTNLYINLVEANTVSAVEHNHSGRSESRLYVVSSLTARNNTKEYTSITNQNLAENLPYHSTVTLTKYDADEEASQRKLQDTQFTLFRSENGVDTLYEKASTTVDGTANEYGVFTTDENGKLTVVIPEKGTYVLKETKPTQGYYGAAEGAAEFTFTLQDTADGGNFGYDETHELKPAGDATGVPNNRKMGSVVLTKTDTDTQELLDGVVYTLERTSAFNDGVGGNTPVKENALLKNSVEVETGKSYQAEKENDGWKLAEITSAETVSEEMKPESGKLKIFRLNWGDYTLTEKTELSGYKLEQTTTDGTTTINNKFQFSIGAAQDERSTTDPLYQTTLEAQTENHTNTKNQVTFYKYTAEETNDASDETPQTTKKSLAGAVFEVHVGAIPDGESSCGAGCTKAEFFTRDVTGEKPVDTPKVTEVTTDENGQITIYGLPTQVADNTNEDGVTTYHLVETVAPKGYKLQRTPIAFTIDRQGVVKVQDASVEEVEMSDEPIKVYIQKWGEGTDELTGAEFKLTDVCPASAGESGCNHTLADGTATECDLKFENASNIMIPLETLIGGHTYTLTETKAPDGYECTAVVTFTVDVDGKIGENPATDSKFTIKDNGAPVPRAEVDSYKTTLSIRNEKIRMSLEKQDYANEATKLENVTFTLTPVSGSEFVEEYNKTDLNYNETTNTYTFTTANGGKIEFPDGLLIHDNTYLLQEISNPNGYYLGKEAKDGVLLRVSKEGYITVERLEKYKGNKIGDTDSCPVTVPEESSDHLVSKNMRSTSFDLTKLVEGNMGDLTGRFQIELKVQEPDGTEVGTKTITLQLNQRYDSVKGVHAASCSNPVNCSESSHWTSGDNIVFDADGIPVGATLTITEDNTLDYAAIIRVGGNEYKNDTNKGVVWVKLERTEKISIQLVNKKDVAIDVGVSLEDQAPLAFVALLIPALWLGYRYKKKRMEGDDAE